MLRMMMGVTAPPETNSLNRVLAGLTILATGWTIYGTSTNINRFLAITDSWGSAKMPVHSTFPIERHAAVAAVLVTLCVTCLYRAYRKPDQRSTIYLNVAGIVVPLLWWILQTTMFYISVSSVLSGIRSH
jgi:hypothetical protein